MSKCPELRAGALIAALCLPMGAVAQGTDPLGLGRAALPEEIAAWDVNVMPDGRGLPEGGASVEEGEAVFVAQCASCHGDFAEGLGRWPKLAGGWDTLDAADPVKTVGSYWPHLSTAWDYIHRSMPYGNAQSLTTDEVYGTLAYILYSHDLVEYDFVLSDESFASVEMPNADGFVEDGRAEAEYDRFTVPPCMSGCKDSVEITKRASAVGVTPQDESQPDTDAEAEAPAGTANAGAAADAPDPELVAAGEKVFRKCKACHQVGEGAKNRSGPHLNGIVGRPLAAVEGFRYSRAMDEMGDAGEVWDAEALAAFLADPRDAVPRTKMSFAGLRKPADIEAVMQYLRSFSR